MSPPRLRRRLATDEDITCELLQLCEQLGRPPTYDELGGRLTIARSSVHDACVRLRAAGILRSEPRISLTPHAQLALARLTLGLRDPQSSARALLMHTTTGGARHGWAAEEAG